MATVYSRRWIQRPHDREAHPKLVRELGFEPVTASILIGRGIDTPGMARSFVDPSVSDLWDPLRLNEMDRAVSRIRAAVRRTERVVIYGDYDVDGITATTLYLDFFKRQGLDADFYIPHRLSEGYGLNEAAVRALHARGTTLLITADCGTTSVEEIRLARSLGMDVIVTDHHDVPDELPPATALLNPKRNDAGYPEKGLCTAGLTFKVIQALTGTVPTEGLDLVALGTVADVCPLTGENRFLVKEGLKQLTEGRRPGVRALKEAAGVPDAPVKAGTVGFTLAPRINASGRLTDAGEAVRLLTTPSLDEARRIAQSLNLQNRRRQAIEEKILEEACARVESESDFHQSGCIVLASRAWHVGVVGIVAARLVERYGRPAVLLAIDPDGLAKGSARSIAGFHLCEGLRRCREFLIRFGGHQAAAGLTLREERIPALRERLSAVVFETLKPEDFQPKQFIDAAVECEDLTPKLVRELESLAPFGPANPEPTLLLRGLFPVNARIVGGNHLKFSVQKRSGLAGVPAGVLYDAIGFRMGDRMDLLRNGSGLDLVFTPERNAWQGREQLQLRVKDLRISGEACLPDRRA
ncbi:MAG TPA: single-stranded-DNA-specific exonuclease RecJ [Nitrospiria bacterium]|nr:single-stranded-DNA-specific exonuclease RecJ [Nitrospiria bacterium]